MVVWSFGLVLHCSLIFYFSFRHLPYLKIRQVYASYFIVYVGIAMAAVTAKAPFSGRFEAAAVFTLPFADFCSCCPWYCTATLFIEK